MHISRSQLWKYARLWGRGFSRGSQVFYVGIFPWYFITGLLQAWAQYPVLYGVSIAILLLLWVVFAPPLVALADVDPRLGPEQVKPIESRIDETLTQLGVDWNSTYLSNVNKLLDDGSMDAARKMYHEHAGGTWDEANRALWNWRTTLVLKKLEMIQQQLRGQSAASSPIPSSIQPQA